MTQPLSLDSPLGAASGGVACTVLLVDDQAIIGEAVRRMLSDAADIRLHFCPDPAQALSTAQALNPTVILQDLVMPGTSGFALLGEYRNDPATRDIPVLVLSTKEDPVVKSEAFAAGASDYLVKLPDRIELAARIRLHSQSRLNQLQRDAAYAALRDSERQLLATNAELLSLNQKLAEATEALRVEATHDALSGLLNRRAVQDSLQREVARAARSRRPLAVVLGDIDHFKSINDAYGHLAGDAVIREVGARLMANARASDLVGRYGGEEFIAIVSDGDFDVAREVAERLRHAIATSPVSTPGGLVAVTMSLGVAIGDDRATGDELIRAADEALYRAKRAGRNRIVCA